MGLIFLVDDRKEYSYENLINDINKKNYYSPFVYVKGNHPYDIFLSIIHSLLHNYSIEILDGDFSERELLELGIDIHTIHSEIKVEKPIRFTDFNDVLKQITENEKWSLGLYTSGTTGRPKKVSHSFKTLIRSVKMNDKFKEDVWAFAYNPTHMAGLQVFFQALLNQNTIVYSFNGQQKNLPLLIDQYRITHISATATFYRNIIPYLEGKVFESIRRISFGGEKYDSSQENLLLSIFPNAKIRNIYASTEAGSLFIAIGDLFEVPETIRELIKINESKELFIHQSLLGKSDSYNLEEQWFKTGDIVELINTDQFKFVSRISDMINVGGYKVNPLEVESTLINVPGVIDLLVKAKENKVTGQILVVDVVKDEKIDEMELKKSIKQFAATHLQEWKVPRIIKFVDEIPKSRTGKKVRK